MVNIWIIYEQSMDSLWILVGGIPTPLKNMKVKWDDYSQCMEKKKTCSKPPTGIDGWETLSSSLAPH